MSRSIHAAPRSSNTHLSIIPPPQSTQRGTDLQSLQNAAKTVAHAFDGNKPIGKVISHTASSVISAAKHAYENTSVGNSFRTTFAAI